MKPPSSRVFWMRTVIWFAPGFSVPGTRENAGGTLPRPAPAPRPLAGGEISSPLIQTSPLLRMGPTDNVAAPDVVAAGTSTVRVNHTTPSKSGSPFDSQLPGTCISFQSEVMSLAFGTRQSGLSDPRRSAIGSASNGTAVLSAL